MDRNGFHHSFNFEPTQGIPHDCSPVIEARYLLPLLEAGETPESVAELIAVPQRVRRVMRLGGFDGDVVMRDAIGLEWERIMAALGRWAARA